MPATPHHARSPRACSSHTASSVSGDDGEQGEEKRVSHIWRRKQEARYCSFPASQVIHVPHARSAGGEEGAASRFLELESLLGLAQVSQPLWVPDSPRPSGSRTAQSGRRWSGAASLVRRPRSARLAGPRPALPLPVLILRAFQARH